MHATKCGTCYIIGRDNGEVEVYDSARLTLLNTISNLDMVGCKIIEITSNCQYCVFASDKGHIFMFETENDEEEV